MIAIISKRNILAQGIAENDVVDIVEDQPLSEHCRAAYECVAVTGEQAAGILAALRDEVPMSHYKGVFTCR